MRAQAITPPSCHDFQGCTQSTIDDRVFADDTKKVAIVACMRKLLTILNAMLRDQATWNAARHLSLAIGA
jgi:hypothetical protein